MMAAAQGHSGRRLAELVGARARVPPTADPVITGLTLDSRAVRCGFAFVALAGTRSHGLDFLGQALAHGAAAVLAAAGDERVTAMVQDEVDRHGAVLVFVPELERELGTIAACFYGEPAAALERVYAVTGTDGKTSVSHFLAAMRDRTEARAGVIGTLGRGAPGQLTPGGLTTPDAIAVQSALADLAASGFREVALEASSHGLAQYRLDGTRIDVAILTQLGRDHLDYHADDASYAAAKARLFDWPTLVGVALNLDAPFGRDLLKRVRPALRRVGYGRGAIAEAPDGSLRAHGLQFQADGIRFRLVWGEQTRPVTLGLLGAFNVDNALAAAAGLLAAGLDFATVADALARTRPVPGRMELFRGPRGPGLVVDYAHNAGALECALAALRHHARGRIWCVFGAGGDRDRGKRPLMAAAAAAGADQIIICDDNPRGEDPAAIVADIVAGLPAGACYRIEHDRAQAIEQAWREADQGDIVLVAGKGHEEVQLRGDEVLGWSDRVAAVALTGSCPQSAEGGRMDGGGVHA